MFSNTLPLYLDILLNNTFKSTNDYGVMCVVLYTGGLLRVVLQRRDSIHYRRVVIKLEIIQFFGGFPR